MKNQEKEIWKDIPGYEGLYQVSSHGKVMSLDRVVYRYPSKLTIKGKVLNQFTDKLKRKSLALCRNGSIKRYFVHQLMAMAFLNHTPCGLKIVVDHIDNNSLNNHIDNLQLLSNRENSSKDKKGYTSKYVGVCMSRGKWESKIRINNKVVYLGRFELEEEASEYYQNALKAIENGEEIVKKKAKFSSKYRGVVWNKKSKLWIAKITNNKTEEYLGCFKNEYEAHLAYEKRRKEIEIKKEA